jgi:hypothetical protein
LGRIWEAATLSQNKWNIPSWGAAQGQIREAIEFLCDGKSPGERAEIADELTQLVRALARGKYPEPQASPYQRDEYERESWARNVARQLIGAAMMSVERYGARTSSDQPELLREIARAALWHMPNSDDELKKLRDWFKLENLKQPHPGDDPLPEG